MKSALGLLLVCIPPQDPGPTLRVHGPSPGVVRLGQAAQLQLKIMGEVGRTRVEAPQVDGLRIRVGPPQSLRSQRFVNGRFSSEVSTTYTASLTPVREGVFAIPPFRVHIGAEIKSTGPMELEAVKDLRGQEQAFLRITPSAKRVYVHEPLRFAVDYGVDNRLRLVQSRARNGADYLEIYVVADWLDELEGAVPIEEEEKFDEAKWLALNDHLQRVEYSAGYAFRGKAFHRFQFEKVFLPSRSGVLKLPAPLLRFANQTGETRRDFFGQRVGGRTENLYAYGEPLEIEVLPIPTLGRPADYYGAVGQFSITPRLDRQRVKVGNSLKLILTIAGRGNTEFLRVPELDQLDGFHLMGATVQRYSDRVVVTYDLSPLSAEVEWIPGIVWNYFDTSPGEECFVELETEKLPVEVVPLAEGEALALLPGEESTAVTPGVDDIFDMKQLVADASVRRPSTPRPSMAALWIALPWLLCCLAVGGLAHRRRSLADVSGRRARGAERSFRRALADGSSPSDALVAYLADRLDVAAAAVIGPDLAERLRDAGVDDELATEVQAAVEAGVAARYGGSGGVDETTARALVARFEARRAQAVPATAVLLVSLLFAPGLAGQGASAAEAAYRAGDYATAAQRFATAAAEPDADRRLHYNLGNCLFRLGRLGEALVEYERARIAMPRDPELLANIRLVQERLELGTAEGEPFLEAVAELRSRLTGRELLWLCVLFNALAAAGLVLFRSRTACRVVGWVALVPAVALSLEVLWLGPSRAPGGIVVATKTDLVAEPREGLDPVLELREGVAVEVLSRGPTWTQVRVSGRSGYVRADSVGVVE